MKLRADFVTNSSSSSYTCLITGRNECGYDLCLSDAEMYQCENGHTICDEFVNEPNAKVLKEFLIEKLKDKDLSNWTRGKYEEALAVLEKDDSAGAVSDVMANLEFRYELPPCFCPICSFEHLVPKDVLQYLVQQGKLDLDGLKEELITNFTSYKEFKDLIKE